MELVDGIFNFGHGPGVDQYVICNFYAAISPGLSAQNGPCLLQTAAVAGHDAFNLGCFGYIDDQDAVHTVVEIGCLNQKRYHHDGVRANRRACALLHVGPYQGVKDGLESQALCWIGEYSISEGPAVKFAGCSEDISPKFGRHSCEARLTHPDHPTGGFVGVDYGNA